MNAHQKVCGPSSGQTHTHEEIAVFLHNFDQSFEREKDAFQRLSPEFLSGTVGQYVALSDGRVVDQDKDELSLVKRVARMPQDKFVLIKRVDSAYEI